MIQYKRLQDQSFISFPAEKQNGSPYPVVCGLIMTKNQKDHIANAIVSALNLCDVVELVDTGSTDGTPEFVKKMFPEVSIHKVCWIENYGEMRNRCLKYATGDWVVSIDSDEIVEDSPSKESFHQFLRFLRVSNPDGPIICSIRDRLSDRPNFIRQNQIFTRSNQLFYFGYVHEELRAEKGFEPVFIDTNIEFVNKGTSFDEVVKFDKIGRYGELLLKNLAIEPHNPRWAALTSQTMVDMKLISEEKFIQLTKESLLINPENPITVDNVAINPVTQMLLNHYFKILLRQRDTTGAMRVANIGSQLFPYDVNYFVYQVSIQAAEISKAYERLLQAALNQADKYRLHSEKVQEDSQGGIQALLLTIFKLLIQTHHYQYATEVLKEIDDPWLLEQIKGDVEFLHKQFLKTSDKD